MNNRRTKQEGIDFYAAVMLKASMDCKQTLLDLQAWFANKEISIRPGYHALAAEPQDNHEHESGEPDIFVYWRDCIVCAIEVTGSDKVAMPADVWISKTKMEYADTARFPVAFALYYRGSRWFIPADKAKQYATEPQTKMIANFAEYYHVIEPQHLSKFRDLQEWVRNQILGHVLYKAGGLIGNAFAEDPAPF